MNIKEILPVFIVSFLLLLNCLLIFYSSALNIVNLISLLSPLLILWMVYSVIRFGKYSGKELKENEEWGYADKNKDEKGVF